MVRCDGEGVSVKAHAEIEGRLRRGETEWVRRKAADRKQKRDDDEQLRRGDLQGYFPRSMNGAGTKLFVEPHPTRRVGTTEPNGA